VIVSVSHARGVAEAPSAPRTSATLPTDVPATFAQAVARKKPRAGSAITPAEISAIRPSTTSGTGNASSSRAASTTGKTESGSEETSSDIARPFKTAVVVPDVHLGHHDQRVLDLVEAYMADTWIDYFINLGDLIDNGGIAPFNQSRPRKILNEATLAEQYELGNQYWDRTQEAARAQNPDCEFFYIEGNHEERTERLVDAQPQFEGMVETATNMRLKQRGIHWIPYWSTGETLKLGKLRFAHGFKTNIHHASTMVRDHSCNLVYGHTHDTMSYPVRTLGDKHIQKAQSLGCLCDLNPPWIKGRPQNWMHAFGVYQFFPDGNFQPNLVEILNYRFVGPMTKKVYKN
jgi:predicted phosphodiesterase